MDNTCKLWDVETGATVHTLAGHTAEIVSLHFNTTGNLIVTGSFDHDVKAWDTRTGKCVRTFSGHTGEISATQFNFVGDTIVSGTLQGRQHTHTLFARLPVHVTGPLPLSPPPCWANHAAAAAAAAGGGAICRVYRPDGAPVGRGDGAQPAHAEGPQRRDPGRDVQCRRCVRADM